MIKNHTCYRKKESFFNFFGLPAKKIILNKMKIMIHVRVDDCTLSDNLS